MQRRLPWLLSFICLVLTGCGAHTALPASSGVSNVSGAGTASGGDTDGGTAGAGSGSGAGSTGTGSTTAGAGGNNGAGSAPTPPTLPSPPASLTAAARFLDQATFGPTAADLARVQTGGMQAYLTAQFATPPTLLQPIPAQLPAQYLAEDASLTQDSAWGSEWWGNTLTAPDQLRQRVAFALSHIYVLSNDAVGGRATTFYYNLLLQDAFGNWRQLMEDVTLSPAMGSFLNLANSAKAAPGEIANENFARENMQLFSLGPNLLNSDGSMETDAKGQPIPTYTQAQVQAFARAFTGLTYVQAPGQAPASFPSYSGRMDLPMAAIEAQHDSEAKALLNGETLPAHQTAHQDLDAALDNIFVHPNLPPFICRQLIQHLVSSRPSPAYVARVAAVFADNGAGVRGDMQAVIPAILLDPEARAGDLDPQFDGGHLREPLLYGASVLRAVGVTPQPTDPTNPWPYELLLWQANAMGQFPLNAPSVFGFFPPGYTIPQTNLNAPEFGLENTASVAARLSFADLVATNHLWQMSVNVGPGTPLYTAAAQSPQALIAALSAMYLHGTMSEGMQSVLTKLLPQIADTQQEVETALYLVITSSEYKISH